MRLFYSYSSHDEAFRKELENHLALLKREALIETWSFRDIDAGADWEREIDERLNSADVILLLISADFIASNYCWNIELRRAMQRAESGAALLIPIILKSCDWKTAPFAKLQALPDGARPVSSWRSRDDGWANVAAGLRKRISRASVATFSTVSPSPSVATGGTSAPVRSATQANETEEIVRKAPEIAAGSEAETLELIQITYSSGHTSTHHGYFDSATRIVRKLFGGKVYVPPNAVVETRPSPLPVIAIVAAILLVVSFCQGQGA